MVDRLPDQIPWLFTSLIMKLSTLANRRDVMVRFLKAVMEGNHLALTDEKRAKVILARSQDRGPENPRHQLQRFQATIALLLPVLSAARRLTLRVIWFLGK